MYNHKKVEEFNRDILGIPSRDLGLMEENEFRLSIAQLKEEIREVEKAYEKGDLVGVVDGLIDLDYFHKGVIYKHGINYAVYMMLFGQVHECNMTKKKGVKESRQGFGDAADAIKPQGWVPPEEKIRNILREIKSDDPTFLAPSDGVPGKN